MNIYFSVDPEVSGGETKENLQQLLDFLLRQGHVVYRAPYVLAANQDEYLLKNFGVQPDDFAAQLALHLEWVDSADVLLADVSNKSEGRSMIVQRALDKPQMGLPETLIIFIKNRSCVRHFGRIVKGLVQSKRVIYIEYSSIEELKDSLSSYV